MFADLCKISKLELENLFLDENKYVKDGVLLVDTSYTNEKSPRITREVCRVTGHAWAEPSCVG